MPTHRLVVALSIGLAGMLGSGTARAADAAMIEAAKKERQVVWYTTLIVNQAVRPLKEAFEKKYPGMDLQYVRADESPTAAKLLGEANAGRVQADVFDGISNMIPLKRAGIVSPYVPSSASLYPPETRDKDGYWFAILLYVWSPGINTALVPKEIAPKTYQDLLAPRWKGKMAWNPSSIAGAQGFVGNILLSMGEERGMAYLRALSKQQIVNIEASSRAILDQVDRRRISDGADDVQSSHHHQRAERRALGLDQDGAGAGRLRRGRHPQGRAASERGAAAGRFSHLGRRAARAAEGRLSAFNAKCPGDEAGAAARGRGFQGDVLPAR